METETFSKDRVVKAAGAFVNVKLDADDQPKLWQEKYRGEGLPTVFVVTGDGEVLTRLVGYRGPEEFADFLEKLPDRVKRLREAKAAAAKSPDDSAAHMEFARAALDLEDAASAEPALEKVVGLLKDKSPRSAEEVVRLGTALVELLVHRYAQERFEDVLSLAELHAKADPEDASRRSDELPWRVAAAKFLSKQDVDGALETLRAGMKRFPSSSKMDAMLFIEGRLLHEKGDHDGAVAIWKKCAETYPDSEWGRHAKAALEHDH